MKTPGVTQVPATPASLVALTRVADASRAWHSDRVEEVLADARRLLNVGAVPTLRQALGLEHREVPINRTLGWLLDPAAPHGAGVALLASFARWLGADGLADEASSATAWCEGGAPMWGDREPDLLFRSAGAALLIENKVNAPEGPRQFDDYAAAFALWSGGRASRKLVVMARDSRAVPAPFEFRTHGQLAGWISQEARNAALPTWTKTVLTMLGHDLSRVPSDVTMHQVEALLARSKSRPLSIAEVLRLSRAVTQLRSPPWENS